jgi:hypothetical protein
LKGLTSRQGQTLVPGLDPLAGELGHLKFAEGRQDVEIRGLAHDLDALDALDATAPGIGEVVNPGIGDRVGAGWNHFAAPFQVEEQNGFLEPILGYSLCLGIGQDSAPISFRVVVGIPQPRLLVDLFRRVLPAHQPGSRLPRPRTPVGQVEARGQRGLVSDTKVQLQAVAPIVQGR